MSAQEAALRGLKRLATFLLGDYSAYFIYQSPGAATAVLPQAATRFVVRELGPEELAASPDEAVRDQAGYLGAQALGFACTEDGALLGLCFYWHGERYRQRNFWPLASGQAKLVQIVTVPSARGRGVATELIRRSMAAVAAAGFDRAYARIWHSNKPSYRAFERAGWSRIAFVAEVHPFGSTRPRRFTFKLRG